MNIVHVVEAFGGGVYSFLVDLCNELVKTNDITIVYSTRKQTPQNFKNDFDDRIRFKEITTFRGANLKENIKSYLELKKIFKNRDIDIIHLHSSKAGFLGRMACFFDKVDMNKVFYNPHGFSFLRQDKSLYQRKVFLVLEKFASKFGGNIVGCSKSEYEIALKLSSNCVNINNGIDTEKIKKIINEEHKLNPNPKIGTVSRACYQKNPKMFNDIAMSFPNYEFVWIGDGELRNQLTAPNIRITGWLSRKEALEELNNLDIYILTSLWEGLPISLLEAMYLKKICVVTNVVGNKDVIDNTKNGFVVNSLEEFEIYIKYIVKNFKDVEKLMEKAYEDLMNSYCKKIMVTNYIKVYENVMKKVKN